MNEAHLRRLGCHPPKRATAKRSCKSWRRHFAGPSILKHLRAAGGGLAYDFFRFVKPFDRGGQFAAGSVTRLPSIISKASTVI